MDLAVIIVSSVLGTIALIGIVWSVINAWKLNKALQKHHDDIKIMNKNNVDKFINSKQWHDHLAICQGKQHQKCAIINNDENI